MRKLICSLLLFLAGSSLLNAGGPHDIASLQKWGPYSKEYYGIAHINDLDSGIKVEFCLVPGQYRRSFKVPCALYETDVHPWAVSADMRHITYRHEIEWKDRVYVDATYHILDEGRVLLESHAVNNTDIDQNINLQVAVRKSGGTDGQWIPALTEKGQSFMVEYPEVDACYGVAWNYPWSEVRQFRCAKLEHLMPLKVHDHVYKDLKGDRKGHYTANFLRPVTIAPQGDTTLYQLLVCGTKDYVRGELEAFGHSEPRPAVQEEAMSFLPEGEPFAFGEKLLEATLLTNVVYPIDAFGQPIRHFCPGKNWNSLYTWDCGFIGWAMSEMDPGRGYEIIRQYTTGPEEEAPFVHHGTPLATQIFAIGDVWKNGGCDEKTLKEIYPRLKRFYDYMSGPDFRKASGLLSTWNIFYNSGGWDDYCPQLWLRAHKEQRALTTPMVSTSYYLRCARILRMLAAHLGLKKDVRQFDADIARMKKAVLDNAWDADTGYFGYVVHDADGKPQELLRDPESGANFNMGLDGVAPLIAGITDAAQNERLLGHIFTPGELWSDCGITAVSQKAPYYRKDGYWNGTVWLPHQMLLWKTMLDLGLADRARQIAFTAIENWNRECLDSYNCYEHFVIESGRGGGWHNFSGLSSPLINWFCAYYRPGTLSTGFNTLVSRQHWNEDRTALAATLEFDKDARGREAAIIVCMSPGKTYSVKADGLDLAVSSPYDGLLEFKIKAGKKPVRLEIKSLKY